jgi:drug/metabolite transporter (DMT)-like permease
MPFCAMSTGTPWHRLGSAILGASTFACPDVLGKVKLNAGADVLTLATFRSYVALILVYAWLQFGSRPQSITLLAKWISLGLGVLFTGNVFGLFKAFELIEVPVAVLPTSSIRCSPGLPPRQQGSRS